MDDQPLVREADGATDQSEQSDPIARVEIRAVWRDRHALDILHDKVGHAVLRAAVEQPRDVRMFQPGEDLPLETEALAQVGVAAGGGRRPWRDLQRDGLAILPIV